MSNLCGAAANSMRCLSLAGILAVCLLLVAPSPRLPAAHAQAERPPMPNMDPTIRLAPPPMSDPPTHLEWGHYNYYLSCMVCHGDRGQGLTDEWRTAGNATGENCWAARCHAASHPPEGFELPRYVPPVIGPTTLLRFATVGDLKSYIQQTMPWWAPGILDEETNWQMAAYLAQANGASGIPANPEWTVLASLPLRDGLPAALPQPAPADGGPAPFAPRAITLVTVALALGGSLWVGLRRRGSHSKS